MKTRNISGKRIKLARISRDMKQVDLCAALEIDKDMRISQTTLSEIEKGSRTVKDSDLVLFAEVLDISPMWLLFGDEPPEFNTTLSKNI